MARRSEIDFFARGLLVIKAENRRYHVVEAVRVLQEVSGTEDVFDRVGRVKASTILPSSELKFVETSMILVVKTPYEVVPGFLGAPARNVLAQSIAPELPQSVTIRFLKSEEALLAQYLMQTLD